jgi:hypothetical protein
MMVSTVNENDNVTTKLWLHYDPVMMQSPILDVFNPDWGYTVDLWIVRVEDIKLNVRDFVGAHV